MKEISSDKTISGTAFTEDPKALEKATAKLKEVGDIAPGEVQDEWKTCPMRWI